MRLGNDEVDLYFEFQKKMLRTNDNPKPFTWHLLAFFGSGNFLPLRPGTNDAILSETIVCKSQVRASKFHWSNPTTRNKDPDTSVFI